MVDKKTNAKVGEGLKYETLVVHSAKYKTLLTKSYKNRKPWEKANPMHEKSYIPGTILKLYVKEGAQVKKGDPLLILEAMKMENTLYAPFDCKIDKVRVKVGEICPKGTLLLEYAN